MKRYAIYPLTLAMTLAAASTTSQAQADHRIRLHVNPKWRECSFHLDPSLTQSAWRRFTQEAGLVAYFRPLIDARPMGAGNFELSLLQWETRIDDASSAWNDTFVHPDSTHFLTEGSGLGFPGLTFRAGVTDRVDVGAYFTKNPQANYGFFGGQVQVNAINDTSSNWAASARLSFVKLAGPDDLTFSVSGVDLLASRQYEMISGWVFVSPYAGVSTYLSSSHETTAAVNLRDERVLGAQASVGAVAQISRARLAFEYNTAKVRSRSVKLGFSF